MATPIQILIAARSKETALSLEPVLRERSDVKVATRIVANGHADPLHGVEPAPDVLLLEFGGNWEMALESLNARPPGARPTVLGVGPGSDPMLLRRAMQAGVRDFFTIPIEPAELSATLQKIVQEMRAARMTMPQRTTAVMNAKGGSGATLIATNLSHIMAAELNMRVALVDLDLQFGSAALSLDLHPHVGVADALAASHEIDGVALEGYLTRHKSGLDVLASTADGLAAPVEASAEQLDQLLGVIAQNYDHVVIDVPRSIDPLTTTAMARADTIVLVLQQHLAHLHDAKRIVNALRSHVDRVDDRIVFLVNRFSNKATVSVNDIKQTLRVRSHAIIPNDYKRVVAAADLGVPLYKYAPSAAITKTLRQLARDVAQIPMQKKGFLKRIFSHEQQRL